MAHRPTPVASCGWRAGEGLTVLGMPTCGMFPQATTFDLVLPRILSGETIANREMAELGHGGLLSRDMAYRFPPYRTNVARGELASRSPSAGFAGAIDSGGGSGGGRRGPSRETWPAESWSGSAATRSPLYSDSIRQRWRHPRFRGELPDATVVAEDVNPLCGDRVRMMLRLDDGRIGAARFLGDSCAICTASADVLAELIEAGRRRPRRRRGGRARGAPGRYPAHPDALRDASALGAGPGAGRAERDS